MPVSDETVVETNGVTVSKFFNAEDFPVPAVAFDVSSTRDGGVTLTITDEIPEEFGIDQIGFHPEYGSEHWTATGDGVVRFEREIDAGESFTTVYGVRMEDDQDETPFLSAPEIDVDGPDIEDAIPPESSDVVRELAGGDRDTVPGLEDEDTTDHEFGSVEADVGDADVDTPVTDDAEILGDDAGLTDIGGTEPEDADDTSPDTDGQPADNTTGTGAALEATATTDGDDTADADPPTDTVAADTSAADDAAGVDAAPRDGSEIVAALADAIRNDAVADEDLATIQDAMGGVPESTRVELTHLQSRVSEIEAYTDALESFIDDNGTAQDVLNDLEDDVADLETELSTVRDDVAGVEQSVDAAADDRAALHERVDDVEATVGAVDDLESSLDRLRGDVDALDERLADTEDDVLALADVSGDVDALEADVAELSEHVDAIDDWRDQLSDVFSA
ncbi:hypothetical protein ACOZ32_08550 [Halobacterium sp. MBLA0001]|uniref:hypothetical protein n=1 Tax=Halobacterium sp. MBLA0001 TaxID=3413511 RepID=UPI003C78DBD7